MNDNDCSIIHRQTSIINRAFLFSLDVFFCFGKRKETKRN